MRGERPKLHRRKGKKGSSWLSRYTVQGLSDGGRDAEIILMGPKRVRLSSRTRRFVGKRGVGRLATL